MYVSHGFVHEGHVEIVYMANVRDIPRREAPIAGMRIHRTVGINGTRLTAMLGDDELGYVEVDSREEPGRQPLQGGWADIGNLHVVEAYRRKRVGTYLMVRPASGWTWLDSIESWTMHGRRSGRMTHFCAPSAFGCSRGPKPGGGARRTRRFRRSR